VEVKKVVCDDLATV